MIITKQYNSGLRLVAEHIPYSHTVSVGVMVNVGSEWENASNNGYSHFIEHMLFKGTTTRSYKDISDCMSDIGAQLNAYTAKDMTCYFTKSVSGDLNKCIELLSDLYFNSVFSSSELEKEKSVVIEEIAMNNDDAESIAEDVIMSAMYGESPLGPTILGKEENINYCDRHSIMKYKNLHYTPRNTVISIAGGFDLDSIVDTIDKLFNSNYVANVNDQLFEEPTSTLQLSHLTLDKDVEQCHVFQGYKIASTSDDNNCVYRLMSSILGGGMSSRLFQVVREQHGMAYSVHSYPNMYKNNGMLEIYCATNSSNVEKLAGLLQQVKDELVTGGITDAEYNRAKVKARNSLYMSLENNLNVMRLMGKNMLKFNQPFDVEGELKDIDNVSKQDIENCMKEVLTSPYASCYVGRATDSSDAIRFKK